MSLKKETAAGELTLSNSRVLSVLLAESWTRRPVEQSEPGNESTQVCTICLFFNFNFFEGAELLIF